jgi:hypothetical protein
MSLDPHHLKGFTLRLAAWEPTAEHGSTRSRQELIDHQRGQLVHSIQKLMNWDGSCVDDAGLEDLCDQLEESIERYYFAVMRVRDRLLSLVGLLVSNERNLSSKAIVTALRAGGDKIQQRNTMLERMRDSLPPENQQFVQDLDMLLQVTQRDVDFRNTMEHESFSSLFLYTPDGPYLGHPAHWVLDADDDCSDGETSAQRDAILRDALRRVREEYDTRSICVRDHAMRLVRSQFAQCG